MQNAEPRFILICCEGKTEKEYFDIITDVFRVTLARTVIIVGEKGQHKYLIDQTINERNTLAEQLEVDVSEVECWAVCDHDKMSIRYSELKKYATTNNIELAFSKPQFEAYLIQHFERSKEVKKESLYAKLSEISAIFGEEKPYEDNKSNLKWLQKAVLDNPKLVEIAIINSKIRDKSAMSLFLTVHKLTEYLISLEPK